MYDTSETRKGLKIEIDGDPYIVVDFQFVKPGKGQSFTRIKIKNMLTGAVLERTYKSGEKLAPAAIEERTMQYLYKEGDHFCFMDNTNYEQALVSADVVGDAAKLMTDNLSVNILFFRDRPVDVTLPNFVEIEVARTDPGCRGDTATGATKPATLTTGATINVPLFVEEGDRLKIDTRNGGEYVTRVGKR